MFCYDDFIQKLTQAYKDTPFKAFVVNTVNENNLLGEGHSKKCYKIPMVDDYVLTIKKDTFDYYINNKHPQHLVPCEPKFTECNFGQTIASDNFCVMIMVRVSGIQHSVPDYINKFHTYEFCNYVDYTDAQLVLAQIRNIAQHPLESYMYLANEFNILNKYNIRVDTFNPNNLLVDDINHTFSILDFEDINIKHKFTDFMPQPMNSSHDMICVLLDSVLHMAYYNVLKQNEKAELVAASNRVIQKCSDAADKIGLNKDSLCTFAFFEHMWNQYKSMGPKALKHYLDFADFYKIR